MRTQHFEYQSVSIQNIASFVVSRTLADKWVPHTNQGLFALWAKQRQAITHDERLEDMELAWIDVIPVSSDGFYFSVEGEWFVETGTDNRSAIADRHGKETT